MALLIGHCNYVFLILSISKKVKHSCYRPGVAQRVPGSYNSQIS